MTISGVRVAALTAAAQLGKVLATLLIIKLIALRHGPEGLGYLGNFMSLVSIASALAGGGIVSGVVKYVSEFAAIPDRLANFRGSAFAYTLATTSVIILIALPNIEALSRLIFLEPDRTGVLLVFLFCLLPIGFANLTYGMLNGARNTFAYSVIVLSGNALAILAALVLLRRPSIEGAILATLAPVVLPFVPAVVYVMRSGLLREMRFRLLPADFGLLSRFSLMILFSAVCFPLVEIVVRNQLVQTAGLSEAGYWQAAVKLSSAYLSFFSLFLSYFLVPAVSPLTDRQTVLAAVRSAGSTVLLLYGAVVAGFALFGDTIIGLVLSDEFAPMWKLLFLQILADAFRVAGWLVGFVVVAKASTWLYIGGELFQGIAFLAISHALLADGGGATEVLFAYLVTNVLYCGAAATGFIYYLRRQPRAT